MILLLTLMSLKLLLVLDNAEVEIVIHAETTGCRARQEFNSGTGSRQLVVLRIGPE